MSTMQLPRRLTALPDGRTFPRTSQAVLARGRRDIASGPASGQVQGTPTVFIDGVLHQGRYDTASLRKALET